MKLTSEIVHNWYIWDEYHIYDDTKVRHFESKTWDFVTSEKLRRSIPIKSTNIFRKLPLARLIASKFK